MNTERLEMMLVETFPDGECTADQLHDWLVNNVWRILTECYDDIADLLRGVSDDTFDYIVSDLVVADEYGDGLAYQIARENLNIIDKEE